MPASLQFPIQIVQQDVSQQRRERAALGRSQLARLNAVIDQNTGPQVAADQGQQSLVAYPSGHADHQDVVIDVVEEPLLASIQATVESLLPEVSRCISYNMPAFRGKRVFFYFAAFKKHKGIYPPVTRDTALLCELAPYRGEKGKLSFPLNQPLPVDLIGRVAVALHREYEHK